VRRRPVAKILFSKAMLLVLLALQLVLGLQVQAARAATSPMPSAVAAAGQDCPTHSAAGIEHHAPWGKHTPMGAHDCCHASACQCHCVFTPGAIALPALADFATSVAIPSLASAQFVAPRIDEFLRPPIA
jgi:hypothetical protein